MKITRLEKIGLTLIVPSTIFMFALCKTSTLPPFFFWEMAGGATVVSCVGFLLLLSGCRPVHARDYIARIKIR